MLFLALSINGNALRSKLEVFYMAHVRKEIRRAMDQMGFSNAFSVHEERSAQSQERLVTIEDWEPNPRAYELKRAIERSVAGPVVVCFNGPHIKERFCLK